MAQDDGLSPQLDAFLSVRKLVEDTGMSADDILRMDMQDYRRLRRNSGLPDIDPFTPSRPAAKSRSSAPTGDSPPSNSVAPAPLSGPPQGIDVGSMDMAQYGQLRAQLGIGQGNEYGRGITNAPSRSWAEAAAAKAARSAMVTSGVEEPRKPARVFVNERANPVQGRRTFYRGA